MNKVTLSGTIVSEIRTTKVSDTATVTRFRLQTTTMLNLKGEIVERKTSHLIDVWGRNHQKAIATAMRSGDMIIMEGSLANRRVKKTGEPDRWFQVIQVADTHEFVILNSTAKIETTLRETPDTRAAADKTGSFKTNHEPVQYEPLPPIELDDDVCYF